MKTSRATTVEKYNKMLCEMVDKNKSFTTASHLSSYYKISNAAPRAMIKLGFLVVKNGLIFAVKKPTIKEMHLILNQVSLETNRKRLKPKTRPALIEVMQDVVQMRLQGIKNKAIADKFGYSETSIARLLASKEASDYMNQKKIIQPFRNETEIQRIERNDVNLTVNNNRPIKKFRLFWGMLEFHY